MLGALALVVASVVGVTSSGRVGPLQIDKSTRADVIAFAGRPDSETHGRYDSAPPFDALGYGCNGKRATGQGGVPNCATVFYVDARSGRFSLLWTEDSRYVNRYGLRVGTPTASVEHALHVVIHVGCMAQLRLPTKHAFLDLVFAAGRVSALVVESQTRGPGVLDCIDS